MGIGGAVIYSLIVMAARAIATALRWTWQAYLDGAALYGAGYYGVFHVTNKAGMTSAIPNAPPPQWAAAASNDAEPIFPRAPDVLPKSPQSSVSLPKPANDADILRVPVSRSCAVADQRNQANRR